MVESLPSKQVVASSSLVSRSTGIKTRLRPGGRYHTTEKIIGSLVGVSGHTFDIIYDLFFTTERVIAAIIWHPADVQQSTSVWKTVLLGDILSGQRWKLEQRKTGQRRRRSLQGMTPDELASANPRNLAIPYSEITSAEITRRFFQSQLRFHVSGPSNKELIIRFNLSKKQIPEARRLLELVSLSEAD